MIILINKKFYKGPCEYIGRPSKLGNPFSHKEGTLAKYKTKDHDDTIESHRRWLYEQINIGNETIINELVRLRAIADEKDLYLGCWCVPFNTCHGEVIKEILESFGEGQ